MLFVQIHLNVLIYGMSTSARKFQFLLSILHIHLPNYTYKIHFFWKNLYFFLQTSFNLYQWNIYRALSLFLVKVFMLVEELLYRIVLFFIKKQCLKWKEEWIQSFYLCQLKIFSNCNCLIFLLFLLWGFMFVFSFFACSLSFFLLLFVLVLYLFTLKKIK